MKLSFARSAIDDLLELKSYYLQQGAPETAEKLLSQILENAQRLIEHPDLGRKVPEFDQDQIRELIQPPFRIVYLRESAEVTVVRVWRSERLLLLPPT